ncbi:MAG: putative tryptophan/tyrosine transport system substrate-binding protein [Candidatus Dependentiae bacterium]|nr:putative tryptophan/tyrosine transport system substrate-binding protein [Candidatus Dependentiae bacterium]
MISFSKSTLIGLGLNIVLGAVLLYMMYFSQGDLLTHSSSAQRAPFRVVFLEMDDTPEAEIAREGIMDAATKEGKPLIELTVFDGNGDKMRLQALADKAVAENYDLIVPFGSLPSQVAKEVVARRKSGMPIVFCGVGDPVKVGLINEPGTPLENITGFGVFGFGFVKPMIDQLPLFAPQAKKILMPYNPTMLGGTIEEYRELMTHELEKRGYAVLPIKIYTTNDVVAKIQPFMHEVDMVWLLPDHSTLAAMEGIGKLCAQYQKFSYITMNLNKLGNGGALAFGYSIYDIGQDVGSYIYRILEKGEKINTLPVLPVRVERLKIGINVENARAQGLLQQMDPTTLYLMEHGMVFEKTV